MHSESQLCDSRNSPRAVESQNVACRDGAIWMDSSAAEKFRWFIYVKFKKKKKRKKVVKYTEKVKVRRMEEGGSRKKE